MLITRKVEFSASHACFRREWTAEQNHRVYGEAANPHGHGHNYVAEITLRGEPDPATGMVFDLKELKRILQEEVVDLYDHRSLNHEVAPFDQVVPTAENLTLDIWRHLRARFPGPGVRLYSVRLYETDDLFVDCLGEEPP